MYLATINTNFKKIEKLNCKKCKSTKQKFYIILIMIDLFNNINTTHHYNNNGI